MSDRLYSVIEDTPNRFRIDIHADDMNLTKSIIYIRKAAYISSIVFVPLFFALASAGWGIIWTIIYIGIIIGLYCYTPSGWSNKPTNSITIESDTITFDGQPVARSSVGKFYELKRTYEYWGSDETTYGIGVRINVTDTKLNCTFPARRLYERTEVLRLLNGALERIPPASAIREAVQSQPVEVSEIFL